MPELSNKSTSPAPAPDTMNLPARMPRIPDDVLERFPAMAEYQSDIDKWWGVVVDAVSETNEESATVVNQNNTGLINLTITVDGVTASVVELAEVVSDGFGNLSGKYTLTVTAGDVVTGMNITSSTGPGGNISEVAFQADKFQIFSGTTKKVMFVADAIDDVVRLADTLVVDAANGKVYIGIGSFADPTTPFYVDDLGRFSLNDKLTWDGSTLTIVGEINADTGMIGGFDIGSDYLRDGVNSFGLASTVTGGDDVRFWAGDTFANRGIAPLRITEGGDITAVSGTIGGFTVNATTFTAGAGATLIEITTSGGAGLKIGGTSTTPGYSLDASVGFSLEAGTNAIFVSRADNFAGSFNRNDDGKLVLFNRSAVEVGSVAVTSVATTYNVASDRRLKCEIIDCGEVGDIIDRIRVREFEFIREPGKKVLGFIAQELYREFPDAVNAGDYGDEIAQQWGVDRSVLVSLLVKEVQSLRGRLKAVGA